MEREKRSEGFIEGPTHENCKRLRAARASLSYSQIEAAKLIGVSQRMFSNYERGVNIPGEDKVRILELIVAGNPDRDQILKTRSAAKALLTYEGDELPPNILKLLRVISASAGKDAEIMTAIDAKIGEALSVMIKEHSEKIANLLLE